MKAVCGKTFRRENVRSNGMQSASRKTDLYNVTSDKQNNATEEDLS